MRRRPATTIVVVAAALLVAALPALGELLILDRSRAGDGEVWRVVTGSLVHLSPSHLVFDVLALGVAGWLIESRGYPRFALLLGVAAVLVGVAVMVAVPEISRYAGASGLSYAAAVYLSLHGLRERGPWRTACALALAVLVVKLSYELWSGRFVLVRTESFVPVPEAHAAGALAALAVFWLVSVRRSRSAAALAPEGGRQAPGLARASKWV